MTKNKNIFASIWMGIAQFFFAIALVWNHLAGSIYNLPIIVFGFFLAIISILVGIIKER